MRPCITDDFIENWHKNAVELYLVRHPRPQIAPGICYGRLDLPLAESALIAAARIVPQLPKNLAALPLWTSPARRCRELAAALHPAPQPADDLQEMHFGRWEGQSWETIDRALLDEWAADPAGFAPPEGESARQLQSRALRFVARLQAAGVKTAVLITHAGILRALAALPQNLPETHWTARHFEYETVLRREV
jgi:alpha-ribazole phosphatase